jgi:hypoxanthine phosphoribosyltransferase
MDNDIQKVLISAEQIFDRLTKLAKEITNKYRNKPLTIIGLSNGAIVFAADLIRQIPIPMHLDTISVSSYRGTESTGKITLEKGLSLCVKNRHVVIVDDILDTGLTLSRVSAVVEEAGPLSVSTCVLLNKQARRNVDIEADFCGFDIDDHFVVGYGLDYNEAYRNLPYIGILKEKIYGSN